MLLTKKSSRLTSFAFFIVSLTFFSLDVERLLYAEEDEARLELHVAPNDVYEGESARLTISVTNAKLDAEPSLEYLENDFTIESLGASNRSSVRVINSIRTENRTVDFNYRITPKQTGVITINPPIVEVDGKKLQASSINLVVREKTKTDIVILEVETDAKETTYPLVPFEVSVNVYLKEYPSEYAEHDPLSLVVHNLDAPLLSIPWLESQNFEDKLVADSLDDWLTELSAKNYGFALNNYRRSNGIFDFGFSFFDEPVRQSYFLPKPQKVTRPDAKGRETVFLKYSFSRKMRATTSSSFSFAPSTLKGNFLDFTDPSSPKSLPVFLSTPPLSIKIKDIPEENAPENYTGIYGNIEQKASLSANEASVGDALTLTLEYVGYGSFTSAKAPDISKLDGIKDVFRVYPASERSINSGVAFDYKLRPLKEGLFEFPSIKTSFFNVESGKFETMESATSRFVAKAGIVSTFDDSQESIVADQTDESSDRNLEKSYRRQQERFKFVAIILGCSFAVAAGGATFFFIGRKVLHAHKQSVISSNRRILESARKTLELGLTNLDQNPLEGFSLIRLAFLQLVGKRLPHSLDSYTDAEILDFLDVEFGEDIGNNSKSDETIAKLKEFFKKLEMTRFGGVSTLSDNFKVEVSELFSRWTTTLLARNRKLSKIARDPQKTAMSIAKQRSR